MNHFNPSKNFHLDLDRLNTSEILIVVTDTDGKIIYVNDKYVSLGYSPEEMLGQNTRMFKTGYHTTGFYQNLWGTILSGNVWKGEIQARRKDGSAIWKFMIIFPLLDNKRRPYHFLAFSTVISTQKEKEERALRKEKQLSSIIETTNDIMGCCDEDGNIFYVNSTQLLGYSVAETEGSNVRSYLDPEEIPKVLRVKDKLVENPDKPVSIEVNLKKKDGPSIPCLVTLKNYLNDPYVKGIVFIYHDISDRKHLSQEMKQWLFFDDLTGLPNRTTFENELIIESNRAKDQETSFAVMIIDIDEFKYIYHSFELQIRDLLLQKIATRIKATFNDTNVLIYRIGIDRFSIILHGIDGFEKINQTAQQVIDCLYRNPFHIEEKDFFISASVGISMFPNSGENSETLLKHAEMAMYQAKSNGKNQYQIFSQKMDLYSYKQFTLRNGARKALLNNEFCVYYQPRINPATNKMVAAEALIRWHHPNWGMVSPDEFIPMAEESGLIIPIGTWMIREIFLKLKEWEEKNIALKKISINLSALQLLHPDLVDTITSILNQTGLNAKWIEFEITETAMIDNEEQALMTIGKLKKLGFSFALDDFGTGYSSINYLRKLPCDTIKIDKSLIDDINCSLEGYKITKTIITLCHSLNKIIVAEGVEKEEQVLYLQKLGCNEIQGYFYSKPINSMRFEHLLVSENIFQRNEAVQPSSCNKNFQSPLEIPVPADITIDGMDHRK